MQKLHIIDALGPFVQPDESKVINWSKVKFSNLEKKGRLPLSVRTQIINRFEQYVTRIESLGYDSISIDDLAHLVNLTIYNDSLQQLLQDYQALYKELFSIAKDRNMKIFVNTDYLFYNEDIRKYLKETGTKKTNFFLQVIENALDNFPDIAGIIIRIGETDGTDVKDTFLSKLTLRSPAQANKLLKKILPLFESHNKTLIFRTWTVGAYKIGDLIWNEKTFDTAFGSIKSPSLIISMKFGDTDFMRYLSLNPLFFHGPHKKIIELQTRREWEGMGTYPSFVGWDYQHYIDKLAKNKNIVGMHVWCQTGGWAKNSWTNVTYLDNSSFWNELNTYVTIIMYKNGYTADKAIELFCQDYSISDSIKFKKLLALSEIAIKKGLYIQNLAAEKLYFRRTRVPTLMWLTWDKVLLSPAIVYLLKILTPKSNVVLEDSNQAIEATQKMLVIANQLTLDRSAIDSLEFQVATFKIFRLLRQYIFDTTTHEELRVMNQSILIYAKQYPQHYTIPKLNIIKKRIQIPRRFLKLFLRETTIYRKRDRVMLATTSIQRRIIYRYLQKSKSHLADQAMGVETLIR